MKKNISNYFVLGGLWVYDLSDYADKFTYKCRDIANKNGMLTRWMGCEWVVIGSWNGVLDYIETLSGKKGFEGLEFNNDKVYPLKELWKESEDAE